MESSRNVVHLFGGGTFTDVAPHLSLAARATGRTVGTLGIIFTREMLRGRLKGYEVNTVLTRQADPTSSIVTPSDVSRALDRVLADPSSKIIVMSCAMVDFDGRLWTSEGVITPKARLRTDEGSKMLYITPTEKVIRKIRKERKDIFLVGFKQTQGLDADAQYREGLKLLKTASCNLVLANDGGTRNCMIITPEQARYHEGTDREATLQGLVDMVIQRHENSTFTRSTIVPGVPVSWTAPVVPHTLRTVVDYCIERGAYKPFLGSTVGHFAVKLDNTHFLTSRRKTDFNKLHEVGLVAIEANGDHEVIAYGSKPSVGGQSQRIVFREHPGLDCIVHFHCPLKSSSKINTASQRPYECGSHQCGKNTSDHLVQYNDDIWAVMLDQHGPNIVFRHTADPQKVIDFIEENWDLSKTTERFTRVPAPVEAVASAE